MPSIELRDSDSARTYLTQGIWLQRLVATTTESIAQPLQCVMALATADDVIPPAGFVADVIRLILSDVPSSSERNDFQNGLSPQHVRSYEDYVLGKLYADASFERASIAICRYEESDRIRAVAWLIGRLCERIRFEGVIISPAVARSLQGLPPEDVLTLGSDSLQADGVMELLASAYDELIQGIRRIGEVLSTEDVFELEKGTALVEFGQRLALRQTLRTAEEFARDLPHKAPRPTSRQRNVPTHILEEDTYPIGGFTSISTRGSVESLLHSELAYMETDEARRPDLFEIKFVRSELLYYSRDENEFLRRRRTFQFLLFPDLSECRIKDTGQSFQRLILILGLQVTLVRKLVEWLGDDALLFEFLFINRDSQSPLLDERGLLQMILSEQIDNGTVNFHEVSPSEAVELAEEHARSSTTHCVVFSQKKSPLSFQQAMPTSVIVKSGQPGLLFPGEPATEEFESFDDALHALVRELV